MLKKIEDYLQRKFFTPPSVADIVLQKLQKAHNEAMQAAHVIETHRFQRHIALSKIEALENWSHQTNVKE